MPKSVFYKIPEDRQLKLLKPALKEFVKKPYDKITVSSLTESMKILRTDFYYYFSDKEDIYQAILDIFVEIANEYKENPTFKDALVALLYKVTTIKSPRFKQLVADLSENYHPLFCLELAGRIKSLFSCTCEDEGAKARIMNKIQLFMTVVLLYKRDELSFDEAKKLLEA